MREECESSIRSGGATAKRARATWSYSWVGCSAILGFGGVGQEKKVGRVTKWVGEREREKGNGPSQFVPQEKNEKEIISELKKGENSNKLK